MIHGSFFFLLMFIIPYVQGMESTQLLMQHEPGAFIWQMPSCQGTWNGYWPPWELEEDSNTKRLRESSSALHCIEFEKTLALDTLEKQYKAACCIAADIPSYAKRDILKAAVKRNATSFVATISPYLTTALLPYPNTSKGMWIKEERQDGNLFRSTHSRSIVPLFFIAQSKKMAKWLWILGADFTECRTLDGGTVLHHLCTQPPTDNVAEILRLIRFYRERGLSLNSVDRDGCTPLHKVIMNTGSLSEDFVVSLALFLLKNGANLDLKDTSGTSCKEYLQKKPFFSNERLFIRHILNNYLDPKKLKWSADEYVLTGREICSCTSEVPEKKCAITLDAVQKAFESSLSICFDCNDVKTHPRYLVLKPIVRMEVGVLEEHIQAMIEQAAAKDLEEWSSHRHTIAVCVAAEGKEAEKMSDEEAGFALLQDDYYLIKYMLAHAITTGMKKYAHWARSVEMMRLLQTYGIYDTDEQYARMHHLAKHGALVNKQVIKEIGSSALVKYCANLNDHGDTPLDLLAHYSYCYENHENKLKDICHVLTFFGGDSVMRKNPRTRQTPLETARKTDKVWQMPCTKLLVDLLSWKEAEILGRTRIGVAGCGEI